MVDDLNPGAAAFIATRFADWKGSSWPSTMAWQRFRTFMPRLTYELSQHMAIGNENGTVIDDPPATPGSTEMAQVGGGEQPWKHLNFSGARPIWSAQLLSTMREIMQCPQHGSRKRPCTSLSPPDYPHAAEDLALALRHFVPSRSRARDFATISSISPWVELTLLNWSDSAHSVTTVDYNPPLVPAGANAVVGGRLRTLDQRRLAHAYGRGQRYALVVAFSGVEHDGLGRYGDPIHPSGDLAAMREMRLCARDAPAPTQRA
jgi:hypothetical protein